MKKELAEMGYITSKEQIKAAASRRKLLTSMSLGLASLIISVVLMVIDPILIIAKYKTRISNGSAVHELLQKEIDEILVSTYLFNVTNGDKFLSGEDHKLKVQEIGPFVYREHRMNTDLELDPDRGVMRYTPKIRTEFMPELSVGYPKDMNVTMPNVAMLSMASLMTTYNFWTRMGFNILANKLNSQPLVTMSAEKYMWGYEEPLITVGNTVLPGWISFSTMGVMDRLYDKNVNTRLEVGMTNSDKFLIKKMNDREGLDMWGYDDPSKRSKCNTFVDAYEGLAYHSQIAEGTPLRLYRNVLCRFLELDYVEKQKIADSVEGLLYVVSNRTFALSPETECLCSRGICIDGVSDLSPCFYGLPLALSNAHFLYADPKLYDRIEGLEPNEEKHGGWFLIEPKIGMVMKTSMHVQVNIVVKDVGFNPQTSKFSDMVVPVAYFRISQPDLPAAKLDTLKSMYVTGPYLFLGMKICLILIGIALLSYSVRLLYWNWVYSGRHIMAFHSPIEGKPIISVELPLVG